MMRVIGLDSSGVSSAMRGALQIAHCYCGGDLEWPTGEYGQTIERCTRRGCPNRTPHAPGTSVQQLPEIPDPPPAKPKKKRKSRARVAVGVAS